MYCEFFGFSEKPFTITPNPQFIYLSEHHREAFAHLLYGIDSHAGFIANQDHLHFGAKLQPGTDRVALDSGNMRVRKGFGG